MFYKMTIPEFDPPLIDIQVVSRILLYNRLNFDRKKWKQRVKEDFWLRWRCRQKCFTSSHNQKNNNQYKHRKQELPENQTSWTSDNQGVKDKTFIQSGRRGGDRQLVQRGCAARQQARWARKQLADQEDPQLHMDESGGTTRE